MSRRLNGERSNSGAQMATPKRWRPKLLFQLFITSQKRVCCYLIRYSASLNAQFLMQKRKPETRGFCGLSEPGFRVWQNI